MFTRDIANRIVTIGDIVYSTYSDAKYKVEDINPTNGHLYAAYVIDDRGTPEIRINEKGKEYTQRVFVPSSKVSRSKKLANYLIRLRNIWAAIKRMGKYETRDLNNYDVHYYLCYNFGIEEVEKRNEIIDVVVAQVCHESTRLHC